MEFEGETLGKDGGLPKTSDPWKKTTKNSTKRQIQPKANLGYFLWIFEISQEKKIRGGDGEKQVGIRGNLRAADTI